MGHTREKKPMAYLEEALQDAKFITEDFEEFTSGIRVLILLHRSKDGATHNSRHLRMVFTNGRKEFEEALGMLLEQRIRSVQEGLRVYSTANERDIQKAIRQFKYDQLDVDDLTNDQKTYFYLGIKSRFSSALMRPGSRATSYFVFDIDDPMTLDEALGIFERSGFTDQIVKQYKTKNGWHIVTKPFNHTKLEKEISFHKDGLLLLKY